jgi:hypothetical protein
MLVVYNKPNIFSCEGVDFKPGVNEVDPAAWAKVAKNPVAKLLIDDKKFEVVGGTSAKGEKVEPAEVKDIGKLPEADAAKLVKHVHDADHLAELKASDKRPAVQKAVAEKEKELAAIEAQKKG